MEDEAKAQPLLPVCPHCGQDPAMVSWRQMQLGHFTALVIFCGNSEYVYR
jgi:hypothetical protein